MSDTLLIRYGEIGTKGKNRHVFEKRLHDNIKAAVQELTTEVERAHARFYVSVQENKEEIISRLQRVFGISSLSPARRTELSVSAIEEAARKLVEEKLAGLNGSGQAKDQGDGAKLTFKVETRRANKSFPLDSLEMSRNLGAFLLRQFPSLKVDVHDPRFVVNVEIREHYAYVYADKIPGPGGLPVGISGKGALLLSGGIDSPVAGYLMMKRGVQPIAVHFHSFPFTSDRSKEKVLDLARVLARFAGSLPVHVVYFTGIQKAINEHCPAKLMVTIMRRMMLRLAQAIARREGALALITGESLGQVASQTMHSIAVTDRVVEMPVYRPLIGADKVEIVSLARDIGTYEISIRPYEDCCTIFVPRHPETHPRLREVEAAEAKLDLEALLQEALERTEVVTVTANYM